MPEPCLEPDLLRAICSGRLSAPDLARAKQHLGACPQCRAELRQLAPEPDRPNTASRDLHADSTRLWQQVDDILLSASHSETQLAAGPSQLDSPRDWQLPHSLPGYTLLEVLGRGGMGTVYKGLQHSLQRTVAIKVPSLAHGSEALQRFLAEAHAVAKLEHPGIVPIYEIITTGSVQFYAMAFIDGPSLQQRLKAGPLPPAEALPIMRAVCDAVEHAHRQRLIHRDLKPANILLTKDGVPKLTDFGLVRRLDDDAGMTAAGQILGTPAYMAPEQARGGQAIDARTDVYALGATLYALLTGEPPFVGADTTGVLHKVIHSEARSPRKLQPALSRDLETICLKCLEKEPDRRYQSAAEVRDELQRVIDGLPIQARPISSLDRMTRWARRQPLLASLSAAVSLVGLIALGLGVVAAGQRSRAQRDQSAAQEKIKQVEQAAQQAREGIDSREQNLTDAALKLRASGDLQGARVAFRRQLADVEQRLEHEKGNLVVLESLFFALGNLAEAERGLGNLREARDLYHRCSQTIEHAKQLAPRDHRREGIERYLDTQLAKTLVNRARCETDLGNWKAAKEHFETALKIYQQVQKCETLDQLRDDNILSISELYNSRAVMHAQAHKSSHDPADIRAAQDDFELALKLRRAARFEDDTARLQKLMDLEGNRLNTLYQGLDVQDPLTLFLEDAVNDYLQHCFELRNSLKLQKLDPKPEQETDLIRAQLLGLSCALKWNYDRRRWQGEAEQGLERVRKLETEHGPQPTLFSLRAKLLYSLAGADVKDGNLQAAERRYAEAFKAFGKALDLSPADSMLRTEIQDMELMRRAHLQLKPPFAPPPFWVTEPESLVPARFTQECMIYRDLLLVAGYPAQAEEFSQACGLK